MYKIGIIGHGPDRFSNLDKVRRSVGDTIDLLGTQYGRDQVVFNIKASIGTGIWAAEACMLRSYKFHLFLPYSLEKTCEHWYETQQEQMRHQYSNAYSLTICNPDNDTGEEPYHSLIADSNFVVCWWIGNRSGEVPKAIEHAMWNNTLALHAMDDLRLITDKDIKRHGKGRQGKTRTK